MRNVIWMLLFWCTSILACETEVPIDFKYQYGTMPTDSKASSMEVKVPKIFNGWKLGFVNLYVGDNMVPLRAYEDEEEFPNMAVYYIRATKIFINGAKISASYTPLPEKNESGEYLLRPCLHVEEYIIKI